MNSIERRFNIIAKQNPRWGAYVCLSQAVTGRKYNHKTIRRNFLSLVPKDDYEDDIEKDLIAELGMRSNARMDVQNSI